MLNAAKKLARLGFHVFPLNQGGKLPAISGFPEVATNDLKRIEKWWLDPVMGIEQPYGVGISTSSYNGGKSALLVVDVDAKKKTKNGFESLFELELEGFEFPTTCEQITPTGGRHLIYRVPKAVTQGTHVLGPGLDIRSSGGYIVGAGTELSNGLYTINNLPIADAPKWIIEKCGLPADKKIQAQVKIQLSKADQDQAEKRATEYLLHHAPLAVEGAGGDQTTFQVACKMRDFGLIEGTALSLMAEHWNPECSPPWNIDELKTKVENAYAYAKNAPGTLAPENEFEPLTDSGAPPMRHPFHVLNDEFAFVLAGGGSHILWETVDSKGIEKIEHLSVLAFHQKFASKTLGMGDGRRKPLTELWMKDPARRSYDGICFAPGLDVGERFYNLWRGFSVKPYQESETVPAEATAAFDAFLNHARDNICQKDEELFQWLMAYFAHLIQKPWEKPLVALVFRGSKGVGKNVLINQIGALIKSHFLVTSNRRYLMGNFNGHLENLLLFALDEAFWSGDKQLEGVLKDLITGDKHVIERKGQETYTVDNCARIAIIGNEEWVVPASQDERRFAVFDVGDGKKQDIDYFTTMREGMEAGGSRLLLKYLQDFNLSGIEINRAPKTQGLLDQKLQSLTPLQQWVYDSLVEGAWVGNEFEKDWTYQVPKEDLRSALRNYTKERNISWRMPSSSDFTKRLKMIFPEMTYNRKRVKNGDRLYYYEVPSIGDARKYWEQFIGHKMKWDKLPGGDS